MTKKQLLIRFEDMASGSMNAIKEFGFDENLPSVVELNTLVWATKELTDLSESEMEKIIERATGLSLNDLVQIEESYYN